MGLEDRDYMSEDRSKTHDVKVCPKTGHWIGLSDCSKCEENCYTKKLLFINSSNSIKNLIHCQVYRHYVLIVR